jgi:hypothetical protein
MKIYLSVLLYISIYSICLYSYSINTSSYIKKLYTNNISLSIEFCNMHDWCKVKNTIYYIKKNYIKEYKISYITKKLTPIYIDNEILIKDDKLWEYINKNIKSYSKNIQLDFDNDMTSLIIIRDYQKKVIKDNIQENREKVPSNDNILSEFMRALEKESHEVQEIVIPLTINNEFSSNIRVSIDNDKVSLFYQNFYDILDLTNIEYKRYEDSLNNLILLDEFLMYGINFNFDRDLLILKINIPPKYMRKNEINFQVKNNYLTRTDASLPVDYSGAFNTYLTRTFLLNEQLNINNNIFFNIHDFILNGSFSYIKNDTQDFFFRGPIFIEKDDIKNINRYSFGDIYLSSHNRLASNSVFGISSSSVNSLLNINNKDVSRINEYDFYLKEDSKVKLYVNNVYKSSFNLKAGRHSFNSLSIESGVNSIKLVIEDRYGKVDEILFDDYSYNQILEKGSFLYRYGLGINRDIIDDKIVYDKTKHIYTLLVDYGLFDDVSLKLGGKLDNNRLSYAFDTYFGSNYGFFNFYNSKDFISSSDHIKKLGLNYKNKLSNIYVNTYIENQIKYRDDTIIDKNSIFSIILNRSLNTKTNIGIYYFLDKNQLLKRAKSGLNIQHTFKDNIISRFTYDITKVNGYSNKAISIYLSYKFDDNIRYTITQNSNKYNKASSSTNKHNLSYSNEEFYSYIDITNTKGIESTQDIGATIDKLSYKIDLKYIKNNKKTAILRAQSSIVFANSSFGYTKPISSSFIILDNNTTLKDNLVGIKGYKVSSTIAIPNPDYNIRKIIYDDSSLLPNYFLKQPSIDIKSRYKSANLIEITLEKEYLAKGFALNKDKTPISFEVIEIMNLDTNKKYDTFTNMQGIFYLSGLTPGKYEAKYFYLEDEIIKEKLFYFEIDGSLDSTKEIDLKTFILK